MTARMDASDCVQGPSLHACVVRSLLSRLWRRLKEAAHSSVEVQHQWHVSVTMMLHRLQGQEWTTIEGLVEEGHHNKIQEIEPGEGGGGIQV